MRRSTKRLAAAILIAALGILSACGTSAAISMAAARRFVLLLMGCSP